MPVFLITEFSVHRKNWKLYTINKKKNEKEEKVERIRMALAPVKSDGE